MKIFNKLKEQAKKTGNFALDKGKEGLSKFNEFKENQDREDFLKDGFYDKGDPIDFGKDYSDELDKQDVGLPPTQKPASFFHFILENQYRDIEMLVRGYKEVKDKNTQKWRTVKKENHCFTDEEAEKIIRIVQAHLSPDIKLGVLPPESFKIKMLDFGDRLMNYVEHIMYYQFGRFKESEQLTMKEDALIITQAILSRVSVNYSRAVKGQENRYTHESVKGQESLQNENGKDFDYSY